MAPSKPSVQSRQVISAMEAFEERLMKELEALKFVRDKIEGIDAISSRLEEIDKKMEEQAGRIDAVQAKVNLTMSSIADVRQEQVSVAKGAKAAQQTASPRDATEVLLPSPPPHPPPPPLQVPRPRPQTGSSAQPDTGRVEGQTPEGQLSRRPWMPKMDFPRFEGDDVRIWIDGCESFFLLYDIPENFKVTSATLHLGGDATHWYLTYK